ncbi:MAG: MetQ/NlpA family ABC transporter substrate-binding protein [Erysipelotrichaceae bacterium]|nr:MetQ/NlpA family ABC transporter substrate-binding protein [Erysipelotrichaceae bacterium]
MKKLLSILFACLLVVGLTACGSKGETKTDEKKITVAASPVPHAVILEKAGEILKEQGWTLEVKEFEDYVQPIEVVESGDIDCNYFAHTPYLNNYNAEKGTTQTVVAGIHYEPYGIYPGTRASLADLQDGDEILVPNDGTNETRALLLLQDNGIITLPEGTDVFSLVTALDATPTGAKVVIKEVEAAQISRLRDQAAVVVLNGNYALAAGLSVAKDSIAYETSTSNAAETYVNVISVKAGNENNEGVKALCDVLQSQAIVDFINETYDGSVIPFVK